MKRDEKQPVRCFSSTTSGAKESERNLLAGMGSGALCKVMVVNSLSYREFNFVACGV